MHAQPPMRRDVGVEQERQRVGDRPIRAGRDQQPQRMRADQRMQDADVGLDEMRRLIHALASLYLSRFGRGSDNSPASRRSR